METSKRLLTKGWSITSEPLLSGEVKKMEGYACFRAAVKFGGCPPKAPYTVGINVYGADLPVFGGVSRLAFNAGTETIDGVSRDQVNRYVLGTTKANKAGQVNFRRVLPVKPGTYDVQLWIAKGDVSLFQGPPQVCYKSGKTFGDSERITVLIDASEYRTHDSNRMLMHPVEESWISYRLLFRGSWEPVTTDFFKKEIKPGDVVLDIGAHIGYYTLLCARLVGETGRVFAFEPDPKNFALLVQNVKLNGYSNVTLVQKAVSNRNETVRLFLDEAHDGDHSLIDLGRGRTAIDVEAVRLDDYFADYDGPIDFIKIDIEGAEPAAVEGMAHLLDKNSNVRMITEYLPPALKRAGVEPTGYLRGLEELGFELLYTMNERNRSLQAVDWAMVVESFERDATENLAYVNLFCVKGGPIGRRVVV